VPLTVEVSDVVRDVPPVGVPRRSRDNIRRRIIVDGEFKAERIAHEANAFSFCALKAA
jgi:hypothetical protein